MRHVAAAAWSPASDRKIYIVWIGVIWAAILAGFGLDFARYRSEGPPPFILHVHAAVFVLWLGLVTLQILWVEIGNLRRHKQLGWVTVAMSVLVVPLGLAAALVDQVRQVAHADYAPQFLALEFHLFHLYDRRRHLSQESGRAQTTDAPLGGCYVRR